MSTINIRWCDSTSIDSFDVMDFMIDEILLKKGIIPIELLVLRVELFSALHSVELVGASSPFSFRCVYVGKGQNFTLIEHSCSE